MANWKSILQLYKEARTPHFLSHSLIQANCGILSISSLRSTFLLNLRDKLLESTKKVNLLNWLRSHFVFLNVLVTKLVTKNCLTLNNNVTKMLRHWYCKMNSKACFWQRLRWHNMRKNILFLKISSKFNDTRLFVY